MRTSRPLRIVASILAVGLALTSCSPDDSTGANRPAAGSDATTSSESSAAGPTIEIGQEGGQITPLGDTVEAEVGQENGLVVDSGAADELHLHSDPEQSFDVKAKDDQEFRFTIDAPGTYDLESHELGVVVVKLQVS
jgi:plastocyanin